MLSYSPPHNTGATLELAAEFWVGAWGKIQKKQD